MRLTSPMPDHTFDVQRFTEYYPHMKTRRTEVANALGGVTLLWWRWHYAQIWALTYALAKTQRSQPMYNDNDCNVQTNDYHIDNFCNKVKLPIIGVVENMSGHR